MFICHYCGIHYETFRTTCIACGAPLRIEPKEAPEVAQARAMAARLRRICDKYLSVDFKDGDSISDKRMEVLSKNFRVFPIGKEIYFYCDTTPIRNGKRGFLICEDGVYWQNSWHTDTNRNFVPWDKFKEREIAHVKFDLQLGKGDVIDMAGLGSHEVRETVARLFKELQAALNEPPQEQDKQSQ